MALKMRCPHCAEFREWSDATAIEDDLGQTSSCLSAATLVVCNTLQ